MRNNLIYKIIITGVVGLLLMSAVQAGTPVWTFIPSSAFPPRVTVASGGMATVRYTVTNQSTKIHTLRMKPIQGITPSGCTSPLTYHQSCTLNLSVNGSAIGGNINGGPVLCEMGNSLQCYQPSQANSLAIRLSQQTPPAILTPSVSTLALSINCQPASVCTTTQNTALTGNSRQIIVQNTGAGPASNVAVDTSGLPLGTTISSNTCTGTLNAGSSCIITVTPGNIASADAGSSPCTSGTEPIAGTITIRANGGISSEVNIFTLGYGCQYQGGFIYSVDDTTLNSGSIGGKVTPIVDQAAPRINSGSQPTSIIWSSDGTSGNPDFFDIPGIYETSITPCLGIIDGACNSNQILNHYSPTSTYPLSYYAAGLCEDTISGYSDWYLPAVCELDSDSGTLVCPVGTQSMSSNLSFLVGDPAAGTPSTSCSPPTSTDCLAGSYWSSTEYSVSPEFTSWFVRYNSFGNSQGTSGKQTQLGVRCSRLISF